MTSDSVIKVEYLYELWEANWDDGPMGNWQILRYEVTKKTPKRIYISLRGRTAFVDRQQIESDGEFFYRPTGRILYLSEPDIPHQPKPPSLPELKQIMADAHPDRGGTEEAFIAARRRYKKARDTQLVSGMDLSTGTHPTAKERT